MLLQGSVPRRALPRACGVTAGVERSLSGVPNLYAGRRWVLVTSCAARRPPGWCAAVSVQGVGRGIALPGFGLAVTAVPVIETMSMLPRLAMIS